MSRLFVLDALGLAYRAYYAFIRRPLVNSKGENTSAIFGFANMAMKIRRDERPEFWALAWDGPGPTFRHDRFPDYKATRKPMPDDLRAQIPAIESLAQAIGLPLLEIPGCEADDVMATLAAIGEREGLEVVLVTSDKDLLQLVNDRVKVLAPAGRGEDYTWVDRDAVHGKWGVAPEQIRDVLALMGDTSDNVPGVPGVGEKTAVELITAFGSLDALYDRLPEVKRPALREKLSAHRSLADLSRELVTVKTDLELPVALADLRLAPVRRDDLRALARRWEVPRLERLAEEHGVGEDEAGERVHARSAERRGTAAETPAEGVKLEGRDSTAPPPAAAGSPASGALERRPPPRPAPASGALERAVRPQAPASGALERAVRPQAPAMQAALDLFGAAEAPEANPEAIEAAVHEVRARSAHGLALVPVLDGEDPRRAPIAGLALAARDGTACYVPLAHAAGPNVARERLTEWFGLALEDRGVPLVAADAKALLHVAKRLGLKLAALDLDLRLASFLCDPGRDHALAALAADVLGEPLPALESQAGRGKRVPPSARPVAELVAAGCAHARAAALLADALRAQVEARSQWPLYETLERPLVPVLAAMESAGIALDRAVLDAQAAQAGAEIARLEGELQALAGEPVNLQSGPQISKLLFERFGLKPAGKTASGALSTRSDVLEDLAHEHPFPKLLLEYRALAKLKSTYLDALPLEIDPADGRVHTTYDQAGAATGRLSSSSPNLQNIPIRTPQGRSIRRAFEASPGATLVGADYSQIELRVMAHLSHDPQLIDAFRGGEDVHASTARRVFGVTGDLDPALRARAKIVNFGVMYGMGARSLSAQMEIPLAEAQEFIAHYFRVYARVREYLDGTVEEARRRGYVETLLGRRRYLPGLQSTHGGERANAERAAINAPIQGTAADLVKLAMIRVHAALRRRHPGARLLLQVHDELLFECPESDAAAVAQTVRAEMEGCLALDVPLVVSVGVGRTWFDVH